MLISPNSKVCVEVEVKTDITLCPSIAIPLLETVSPSVIELQVAKQIPS